MYQSSRLREREREKAVRERESEKAVRESEKAVREREKAVRERERERERDGAESNTRAGERWREIQLRLRLRGWRGLGAGLHPMR